VKFALVLILAFVVAPILASAQIPAASARYKAAVIREAHAKGGLVAPVALFAGQITQESRFNPNAKSGVGAEGLSQFMPATAAWIAQVYPKQLGPAAPLDAGWAIRALVYYDYNLYGQLASFKDVGPASDRWAASLSSYNGGLVWVYRDQKAVTCDRSLWWACVALYHDGRIVANWTQNREYPEIIMLRYAPLYVKAGWR
jgi:soluble lytic murein transglycosylase-like protein